MKPIELAPSTEPPPVDFSELKADGSTSCGCCGSALPTSAIDSAPLSAGIDPLVLPPGALISTPVELTMERMRRFMADAAHELRTPIASLRANIQVLQDADLLPEADEGPCVDRAARARPYDVEVLTVHQHRHRRRP